MLPLFTKTQAILVAITHSRQYFFCKKVFIFSKFYMLHYNIAVYLSSPPRSDWEDIQGNMSSSRRN